MNPTIYVGIIHLGRGPSWPMLGVPLEPAQMTAKDPLEPLKAENRMLQGRMQPRGVTSGH